MDQPTLSELAKMINTRLDSIQSVLDIILEKNQAIQDVEA